MSKISVTTRVQAPLELVWHTYHTPQDIQHWNSATADWETVHARADFRVDGEFSYRMQAKDGSMGFDFVGIYRQIIPMQRIEYQFDDRMVSVTFSQQETAVQVCVTFDPETVYPEAQQRQGWQAILDHFAAYTESKYAAGQPH